MASLKSDRLLLPEAVRGALRAEALRRAGNSFSGMGDDYPPVDGTRRLRAAIEAATPHWSGGVLVANSATEATWLALSLAAARGARRAAVRVPCYFALIRQVESLGMELVPWESFEDLECVGEAGAIVSTTNFTPPSGLSPTAEEKARLAACAARLGALVVEDNPYDPLWFDAPPTRVPETDGGRVLVGSLSKIASPRLRLGFLRAEPGLLSELRSRKITLNLSTAPDAQDVAAAALAPDILRLLREDMAARADRLRAEILDRIGVEIPKPQGGSYLQLPLDGVDTEELIAACSRRGLEMDSNARQFPDGRGRPWLRLHLGAVGIDGVEEVVGLLKRGFDAVAARRGLAAWAGKRILIAGGRPREDIDGVRCWISDKPKSGGAEDAAEALALAGAEVVLVRPRSRFLPKGARVVETVAGDPIVSAADLLEACRISAEEGPYDAALNLADASPWRAVETVAHKLKAKSDGTGKAPELSARANVDLQTGMDVFAPDGLRLGLAELASACGGVLAFEEPSEPEERPDPSDSDLSARPSEPGPAPLAGRRVVVTNGPTEEPLSTGGVLSNFSSGRQGRAVAEALRDLGADVVLISGPVALQDPEGMQTVRVRTAMEMLEAVVRSLPADAFVGVAAVADFKGEEAKTADGKMLLPLSRNPDVLAHVGRHPTLRPKAVVGFAAETRGLAAYARAKLAAKGADAIVANLVGEESKRRAGKTSRLVLVRVDGEINFGEDSKQGAGKKVAAAVVDLLSEAAARAK